METRVYDTKQIHLQLDNNLSLIRSDSVESNK